ncbi:hypothetical protein Ahy_A07g035804 isoform B [Arachis hypogaea]|uniref:Uncharacterized protein n=1 Tax=Arachis hypogaea TaxID=3818 RepID=A0A445CEJ8_ARAHY|nr:hypothetical protein Ahy_A07g035804 isoform B [Arachis hypogaea]
MLGLRCKNTKPKARGNACYLTKMLSWKILMSFKAFHAGTFFMAVQWCNQIPPNIIISSEIH